jgi:lysophospholipase L1-like esterase
MVRRFMIKATLLLVVVSNVALFAVAPLHADTSAFQYTPTNLAIPAPSISTLLAPVTTPSKPGGPGNNDPKPQDIVSVQPANSTVTVLPSNGNGTVRVPITTVISGGAQAVAVADFNGDGILDIAVTQLLAGHQDGDVVVLTGDGKGNFSNPQVYASGRHAGFFSQYSTVQAADINHDGHPDIILGEFATECCNQVGIEVLLNNGSGSFSTPVQYPLGSTYVGVLQLTLADMNNDGNLDAVTTNSDPFGGYAVMVQLGRGDGTFAPPVVTSAPWPRSFALADLNHDGIMDVVTSTDYYKDNIPRQLAVYMGKGDGSFQPPVLYDVPLNGGEFKIAIIDGNNDGFPDVAVASPADTRLMFFQNDGKGALAPVIPAANVRAHTTVTALLSGYINSDTTTDLLSVNAGGDPGDGTTVPADMTLFLGMNPIPPPTPLAATFGSALTGTIMSFSGVVQQSGLTATIDWGDGTQTSGTVQTPTAASAIVTGSHTYWISNKATVTVTLSDAIGAVVQTLQRTVNISSKYVALGDSFSSGEGATGTWPPGTNNPNYIDNLGSPASTDDPNNNMCHRSTKSYALDLYSTTLAADPNLSMVYASCSGAITQDFYTKYDQKPHGGFYPHTNQKKPDSPHNGEIGQLNHVTKDTSLVTLTIGGNDLGFSDILKACVTGSTTDCVAKDASAIRAAHEMKSKGVLVNVYRDIKTRAPGARIMVLGYPRFFPTDSTNLECSGITSSVHLNSQEMNWLNSRVSVANDLIQSAVKESGVAEYVDVYNAFNGREICSSSNTNNWDMNGLITQPVRQWPPLDSSQESFHPNPAGHKAEAVILGNQYEAGRTAPVTQLSQSIAPGAITDIPIDLSAVKSADSFTLSASWPTDAQPALILYDQNNEIVPIGYPQSAAGYGSTYAYTFVYGTKWKATTWHVHVDNRNNTLAVPLTINLDSIRLRLPPLAKYNVVSKCIPSGRNFRIRYSFDGSVSTADNSLRYPNANKITNWAWSTGQSGKQSKISGTDYAPVDILLTVTDSQGQQGYYAQNLTCK